MGKPEIRFKGYTDEWEQRKLGDIASSFEYGLNAAAKEYDGKNKYIRITDIDDNTHDFLTDNLTSPDIDLTGADNYKLTEGDILFARTGASVGKSYIYRNSDGLVYYAGFLIRARIKEEYDAKFVFQNTLTDRYNKYIAVTSQRSGQPGVNAQEYAEFEINVPQKEEQTKIGTYFHNLDHLITFHQRKCDEIKSLKKYMLQKMFPQNEQKIPEIRFKGFTEDWEQRKLGELYQRNTERNENLIGYDKTISVATMSYKDDGNGASESSLSTYKVIRVGDIAFEGHTNKQFRFGRFVVNDIGTGIMSPRFSTLRPLNEMPVNFWKQYIHSESVMRRILVNSTKAGTMMNELVIPEFLNQTIMVPSENEQAVIGQYFTNIDHLITLHQRKPIPHPNHPTTHTKHKGEEKYVRIRVNDRGKIDRTANLRRFPVDIPGRFKDGGGSVGEFQIYSGAE